MGNILSGKRNKSTKSSKEMDALVGKMKKAGLPKAAVDAFCMNYEQLVAGVTGMVRGAPRLPSIHTSHARTQHAPPLMRAGGPTSQAKHPPLIAAPAIDGAGELCSHRALHAAP